MSANKYIGLPWRESFTCWDLVRRVQAEEFGRELPALQVGEALQSAQDRILLELIGREGLWRRQRQARRGDILTCRSTDGPHVGVMWTPNRVLHNVGSRARPGSVRLDRVSDLAAMGFQRITYWGPDHE
jgi:cell wall-associated NlpC family hydrolase